MKAASINSIFYNIHKSRLSTLPFKTGSTRQMVAHQSGRSFSCAAVAAPPRQRTQPLPDLMLYGISDKDKEGNVPVLKPKGAGEIVTEVELARRKRISEKNKGKVPWNKGRKMAPELRQLITERTKQAMARPEVREKIGQSRSKRGPMKDSTKEKIRAALQVYQANARQEIEVQVALLLERLAHSEDAEEQEVAAWGGSFQAFCGLAMNAFRVAEARAVLAEEGWTSHPWFRERIMKKCLRLAREPQKKPKGSKASESGSKKYRPRNGVRSKYNAAMKYRRQLQDAEEKLSKAQAALAKLHAMKPSLAADPAKLSIVTKMEGDTLAVLSQLEETTKILREKMAPLEHFLSMASTEVSDGSSNEEEEKVLENVAE